MDASASPQMPPLRTRWNNHSHRHCSRHALLHHATGEHRPEQNKSVIEKPAARARGDEDVPAHRVGARHFVEHQEGVREGPEPPPVRVHDRLGHRRAARHAPGLHGEPVEAPREGAAAPRERRGRPDRRGELERARPEALGQHTPNVLRLRGGGSEPERRRATALTLHVTGSGRRPVERAARLARRSRCCCGIARTA